MPSEEITVLPADPEKPAIGWTVKEYQGTEVYKKPPTPPYHDLPAITERDGLKPGDEILVPGMIGGFFIMTVEEGEEGRLGARTTGLLAVLEFGEDDRNAWVCSGLINMRGVHQLELRK